MLRDQTEYCRGAEALTASVRRTLTPLPTRSRLPFPNPPIDSEPPQAAAVRDQASSAAAGSSSAAGSSAAAEASLSLATKASASRFFCAAQRATCFRVGSLSRSMYGFFLYFFVFVLLQYNRSARNAESALAVGKNRSGRSYTHAAPASQMISGAREATETEMGRGVVSGPTFSPRTTCVSRATPRKNRGMLLGDRDRTPTPPRAGVPARRPKAGKWTAVSTLFVELLPSHLQCTSHLYTKVATRSWQLSIHT